MRMKSLAAACGVAIVALGAPAAAQVTGILTLSEADLRFIPGPGGSDTFPPVTGDVIEGSFGSQTFGSGGSFASTSDIGPGVIYFKNGNAATGQYTRAISRTVVDITFTNDGSETVAPSLRSQIVPAGFGMFVAPGTCPNDPTLCNPADPLAGAIPRTFNSFTPSGIGPEPATNVLGSAAFTFRIYADKLDEFGQIDMANRYVAYELQGDMALLFGGGGGNPNILTTNIAKAQNDLTGFTRESALGSPDFLGYVWDTTDIDVFFEEGTLLKPGESATLTYETIVESFTRTNCFGGATPGCLVTYSSFGDPVGRAPPAGLIASASAFASFASTDLSLAAPGTAPSGILFDEFAFIRPTFQNGRLTYVLEDSFVPEPQTWAMLIAGFGLVGATMRRRRRLAA